MKHKTILIYIFILFSLPVFSRQARTGIISLTQPDGTVFNARMKGDEFMRLTTTLEGNAIIQDEYGWWCYATFDSEGERNSSGWKVGEKVPGAILSESRMIPYTALATIARERRKVIQDSNSRFPESFSHLTKSEGIAVKHGIVILAQFQDVKFEYQRQDFEDLLTKTGYSRNGAMGCAKEYFDKQFGGKVEFSFDVSEIVTLPGKREDYGANLSSGQDKDPARMIIEACQAADEMVDFSLYDDDNNGEIDNVFVFFAGADEADGAEEECIWSHFWYVHGGAGKRVVLDGRLLNRYACSSELTRIHSKEGTSDILTGIGTFCHEYCHTFGLADLYDTDYEGSGGTSAGLWIWTSLMDGGNQNNEGNTPPYFNAIEREMLGICEPIKITSDGEYCLGPIDQTNTVYRLDTDIEGEYYLIECRSGKGWDSYIGGSGMLIYHIDRSDSPAGYSEYYHKELKARERWTPANEVNCRPDRQCADLIEADGRQDGFLDESASGFSALYSNIRNIFYPLDNVDASISSASMTDIRWEDGKIWFKIHDVGNADTPPGITNITYEIFPDAAIISFESDRIFNGNASVEWKRTGDQSQSIAIQPYEPGKYAVLIEGLIPDNKTYEVTMWLEDDGIKGESRSMSFMTRKSPAVNWPYIYMNSVARNSDGTIPSGSRLPLRLTNSSDAELISWTFNGKPVTVDGDMYYKVRESGTLKAHIIWKDGSEEVIMKEIIIGKEE